MKTKIKYGLMIIGFTIYCVASFAQQEKENRSRKDECEKYYQAGQNYRISGWWADSAVQQREQTAQYVLATWNLTEYLACKEKQK